MMFTIPVNLKREGSAEIEKRFWFPSDGGLLAFAAEISSIVELKQCTEENVCLENKPSIIVGETGVSGSAFLDNAEFREFVYETFEAAKVLDMESAAGCACCL